MKAIYESSLIVDDYSFKAFNITPYPNMNNLTHKVM